jgi:hypothetical protein
MLKDITPAIRPHVEGIQMDVTISYRPYHLIHFTRGMRS